MFLGGDLALRKSGEKEQHSSSDDAGSEVELEVQVGGEVPEQGPVPLLYGGVCTRE